VGYRSDVVDALTLGLVNATNARDLGGYRTTEGRTVRRGVLFRSNTLHRLSDEDLQILAGLKLACVIDFRHEHEIALVGSDRLPSPPPGKLISLPIFDPDHDVFGLVAAATKDGADPALLAFLREDHASGGTPAAMTKLYRWFVSGSPGPFGEAVRLIATAESLPLLFHCTAGKDRTGWLSAIVLSVLGVPRPVIVDDYLRTNTLNADGVAYLLSVLAERIGDPSVLVPMFEARAAYLEAAFDEVDRVYGGLEGYLYEGLRLEEATVSSLRDLLLDPDNSA
jgi:protein-tyrosine phosphatase